MDMVMKFDEKTGSIQSIHKVNLFNPFIENNFDDVGPSMDRAIAKSMKKYKKSNLMKRTV